MSQCRLVAAVRFWRVLALLVAIATLGILPATCDLAFAGDPAAPPFRWTQMERHPENPILSARPDTWESQWFIVDTVLQVDGRWWMYYDGAGPHDKKSTALGLAFSDDAVHWERAKDNPIWTKAGNWSNFLRDVRIHRFEGESGFWMYYSDGDRHIDLARSDDGVHWKNIPENPVLVPSQDWEHLIMQESVLKRDSGQWLMWYSTYGSKPRVTGLATSSDGLHWRKHSGNPVLQLGKPGEWDDYSAFQPWVFYRDGYYHMIYTGSNRSSPTGYQFGYAWSPDGITWQNSPDNPVFSPSREKGAWDAGKVSMHVLLETSEETFNIYYSGGASPEATYTGIGLIRARLTRTALPSAAPSLQPSASLSLPDRLSFTRGVSQRFP